MFYMFQILLLYLQNIIYLPTNVLVVLEHTRSFMEIEAANGPKEIAKARVGPILKPVLAANPIELLIYIGIPLCFLVVGLMLLLICLFKKCPKV